MSNPIVAVAKIGKNVETSTDPNDFIFHSDYNTFKIIASGTTDITALASTNDQSFTQAHGLDYTPLVTAFAKEDSRAWVISPNAESISTYGAKAGWITTGLIFNYVTADATNITFNFDNTSGSDIDLTARYYLFEVPL